MLTLALTRSTLTRSTVRGPGGPQVSQWVPPTGGTRVSVLCKRKKKRKNVLTGSKMNWASFLLGHAGLDPARTPPLLFLPFSIFHPPADSLVPLVILFRSRAESSRSGAARSVCVRMCVRGQAEVATPRTRHRGVGAATAWQRRRV
jgi:hypothetical protein